MTAKLRKYILAEGRKVSAGRRFGFYRWMLRIVAAGYDPRDDLIGDLHSHNA